MNEFKVDVDRVLASGLGFEAYFVLHCLYTNDEQLISSYTTKCKKINTEIFKELEKLDYISIKANEDGKIYYALLSITEKGKNLLIAIPYSGSEESVPNTSEHNFEEFRTFYPSQVKEGFKIRRLHDNMKKCRAIYDKLLLETTHDILCKCARLYYEEKYNSSSLMYMQKLETWLNQKNYLQYVEDAKQLQLTTNATTNDQSEDI